MANSTKILAANIKAERYRKGLTQEQLSEQINLSTRSISAIENGHQSPSALVLFNMAKALEIDINELFRGV